MEGTPKRITLLGKSGSGKSSLANTILGENIFEFGNFDKFDSNLARSVTRISHGKVLTLIDTPGFLDPGRSEKDNKVALISSIIESAPGPHVFLIVLKLEKFTQQEQAIIDKILELFPGVVFKHTVIVFTRGDQLPEGTTVNDFVEANKSLSALVKECGGHCHVVDNKYWKSNQKDEYRSNRFQVKELLQSIDEVVMTHRGFHYTNDMFEEVEKEIQKEEKSLRKVAGQMSEEAIKENAKGKVFKKKIEVPKSKRFRWFLPFAGITLVVVIITLIIKWYFVEKSLATLSPHSAV